MRTALTAAALLATLTASVFPTMTAASESPSAVASIMRLLKSGRVPKSRLGPVVEQIARRGNEHDLAYLFQEARQSNDYDAALRLKVYQLLIDAAENRKVIPAGDLSGITEIVSEQESASIELRLAAIRLTGLWKVTGAVAPLKNVIHDDSRPPGEREAALKAITAIGGADAQQTIVALTGDEHSLDERSNAVAALVDLDVDLAAEQAAVLLGQMNEKDDPGLIVGAFLDRDGGSQTLADALTAAMPSKEVAMLALRHMYSIGRSDPELADILGRIAGIDADPQPLNKQQVAALVKQVAAEGDAHRGEVVFRRTDLSCMKCHAISKAGGQVGPDLSALGASSPVDYIINSISNPDQQIKEAFTTRVVITADGLVQQGIVVDRTNERLVLKDAKGHLVTIPTVDIDEEVEGKSLMPKGLMKFMTDSEFIDLAKFLSMLGKPGTEYAIRQTPRMQRWRVLADVPQSLRSASALEADWEEYLSRPPETAPAYSHVNGDLPLEELVETYGAVLFLMGEVNVSQEGEIGVRLEDSDGVSLSVGAFSSSASEFTIPLPRGRHTIMLRVDTRERTNPSLNLQLFRVPASPAEFEVVDGA